MRADPQAARACRSGTAPVSVAPGAGGPRLPNRVAVTVGGMMLGGAAFNTVLVAARPDVYPALGAWFADLSPWPLGPLEDLWDGTFSEHRRVWGAAVGIGYEAWSPALTIRLPGGPPHARHLDLRKRLP